MPVMVGACSFLAACWSRFGGADVVSVGTTFSTLSFWSSRATLLWNFVMRWAAMRCAKEESRM